MNGKRLFPILAAAILMVSCAPKHESGTGLFGPDEGFDVALMKDVRSALREADSAVDVTYDNDHDYNFDGELTKSLDEDNYKNPAIFDAPRDFIINIAVNEGVEYCIYDHEVLYDSSINYVQVTNQYNEIVLTRFSSIDRSGNLYAIAAKEPYQYDMVYTAEIVSGKPFHFLDKDESIRKLTFHIVSENPEAPELNNVVANSEVKSINLRDCQDSHVLPADDEHFIFEYRGDVALAVGDSFLASDVLGQTDNNSFYGNVVSVTQEGDHKLIEYEPADARDVFTELDIEQKDEPIDLEGADIALTEEVVRERFATNEEIQKLVYAIAREGGAKKMDILDWLAHASVKVNVGIKKNTFTFSIGINWAGVFKDSILFNVNVSYEYKETLTADFKAQIATKFKVVPVGVDYKLKLVEDSFHSFSVKIDFSRGASPIPQSDKIKEGILNRIEEADQGLTDYKSIFAKGEHEAKVEGDGNALTIPLLRVDIDAFYPVSFRIEIDVVIEVSIKVAFVFQYTSHKKTVVFNFSNEAGAENVANETLEESSEIDISFYGVFKAEVGLKVKFAVYLLGFYKYLHVEFFIQGYFGFQVSGMALFHWDLDPDSEKTFDLNASFDFKIYIGAKWGFDIRFLFVHENSTFTIGEKVLYGYRTGDRLVEAKPPVTSISLDENGLDLGASNYLLYDVFEPGNFTVNKAKLIKPTACIETEYGLFVSVPTTKPLLSIEFKQEVGGELEPCSYLKMVGDKIMVSKSAPASFACKMIVTPLVGSASPTEFSISCTCQDLLDVYFDDVYAYSTRRTSSIVLPEISPSRRFIDDQTDYAYCWYPEEVPGASGSVVEYNDYVGMPGETYSLDKPYMPLEEVHFGTKYMLEHFFTVDFFTSTGLHIKTVRIPWGEHLAADDIPSVEECVRNMPGYRFVGWDLGMEDLLAIDDMKAVTGIYVKEAP